MNRKCTACAARSCPCGAPAIGMGLQSKPNHQMIRRAVKASSLRRAPQAQLSAASAACGAQSEPDINQSQRSPPHGFAGTSSSSGSRFESLFALVVMGHGRRQLLWFAVTRHPTAEWHIVGQVCSARPSGPATWDRHHCADFVRIASLLRADIIFGRDRVPFSWGFFETLLFLLSFWAQRCDHSVLWTPLRASCGLWQWSIG